MYILCTMYILRGAVYMNTDRERLVAEVPLALKALVDADERDIREVTEAALWREFGGKRLGAVDRQIAELENRRQLLVEERDERNARIEEIDREIEALEQKKGDLADEKEREENRLEDAAEKLRGAPADRDNPAVQTQAEKVGLTPEELLDELPDDIFQ